MAKLLGLFFHFVMVGHLVMAYVETRQNQIAGRPCHPAIRLFLIEPKPFVILHHLRIVDLWDERSCW
jgi:hypothetical protein